MEISGDRPLQGTRILIAEDNAILAYDLLDMLCEAGADVVGPAGTIKHALALSEAEPLTCSVLDVNLRDGTVFRAAQVLRDRRIGIIFYTGYFDPAGLAREWPGAKVLVKPAVPQLMIRTVSAVCAARRPHLSPFAEVALPRMGQRRELGAMREGAC
jgi:CheY-like chemotaxis protein